MSDPRHAMIFKCDDGDMWLNIVPGTDCGRDYSPEFSETFGPFSTARDAREYASNNFQNTGFEIPVYKKRIFLPPVDDRIDIHYVIDRLEAIKGDDDIGEFKRELIYNLGVNQRILRNE